MGKAKAFVRIDLRDKDAVDKIRKLQKQFENTGKKVQSSFGSKLAKLGLQFQAIDLGIRAVRNLGNAVLDVARQVDEAAKSARQLGLTFNEFTALRHGADQAGVGMEQLRMAIVQAQRQGLTLDQVADRLASIEDPTKRVREAMNILGTEAGPRVLTLLENGSAGLEAMREESRLLGLAIGDEAAADFEHFNDTLDVIIKSGQGWIRQVAADWIPTITEWVKFAAVGAEWVGRQFSITFKALEVAWRGLMVMGAEVWNGFVIVLREGFNAVVSGINHLTGILPDRVKEFIGLGPGGIPKITFEGITIDTKPLIDGMNKANVELLQAVAKDPDSVLATLFFRKQVGGGARRGGDPGPIGEKADKEAEKAAKERAKKLAAARLRGLKAGIAEFNRDLEREAEMLDRMNADFEALRERRQKDGIAERLEDGFSRALDVIDERGSEIQSGLARFAAESVSTFANFGSMIGSAFEAAFSGGDFGAALQQLIGQQLVQMGTSLIQSGVYTLAMAALASIPIIGNAFGGPPAAAAAFALAPLAIAAGTAMVAGGSAMAKSGAEIQARNQRGKSTPVRGRGGSAPQVRSATPRMGPDFGGGGGGGGDQTINVYLSPSVDRRRTAREIRDTLNGR